MSVSNDGTPSSRLLPGQVIVVADATVRRNGGMEGLSLAVEQGEWLSVFGPAASGKTTVLRILAGELRPESGQTVATPGLRRFLVGDERPGPGRLSARNKLLWRLGRLGVSPLRRSARAQEALEVMDLLRAQDVPETALSGGQRIALEIAAALACEPDVLLLDNVTVALAPCVTARLFAFLDDRRAADGLAVVHATTASHEAERADRVLMLDRGRALACGAIEDMMRRYAPDRVTVEAADPSAVRRTLRGIYDVEITETRDGLRFAAADPVDTAANLFRHPPDGMRAVYVARGDLWQVYAALKADRDTSGPGSPAPPASA